MPLSDYHYLPNTEISTETAERYFSLSGLTFADIEPDDIMLLCALLDKQFADLSLLRYLGEDIRPLYWTRTNKNYRGVIDPCLEYLTITARGAYFNDRVVIAFNKPGRVVFCPAASLANAQPVFQAFMHWCDLMSERKVQLDE